MLLAFALTIMLGCSTEANTGAPWAIAGPVGPTGAAGAAGATGPTGPADFSAIGESVIASTDNTYDLGSATKSWANLYLKDSGRIYADSTQVILVDNTFATVYPELRTKMHIELDENGTGSEAWVQFSGAQGGDTFQLYTSNDGGTYDDLLLTYDPGTTNTDIVRFTTTAVEPGTDNAIDLGTTSKGWKDIHMTGILKSDAPAGDAFLLINDDTDTGFYALNGGFRFLQNNSPKFYLDATQLFSYVDVKPSADGTIYLGGPSNRWEAVALFPQATPETTSTTAAGEMWMTNSDPDGPAASDTLHVFDGTDWKPLGGWRWLDGGPSSGMTDEIAGTVTTATQIDARKDDSGRGECDGADEALITFVLRSTGATTPQLQLSPDNVEGYINGVLAAANADSATRVQRIVRLAGDGTFYAKYHTSQALTTSEWNLEACR